MTDGSSILAEVVPTSGVSYLVAYDRTASGWVQSQLLYSDPGDTAFSDLALSHGVLAAASATPADDAGASTLGDVYVFDRDNGGWVRKQILRASSLQPDAFWSLGWSVATDSKTTVAGAPGADGGLRAAIASRLGVLPASSGLVTSRISRLECRSKPMRTGDTTLLARYDATFATVRVVDANARRDPPRDGARRVCRRLPHGRRFARAVHAGSGRRPLVGTMTALWGLGRVPVRTAAARRPAASGHVAKAMYQGVEHERDAHDRAAPFKSCAWRIPERFCGGPDE